MNFQIVRADVSDAEAIAAVIQTCYEQMEHKEWYVPDDAEYMRKLLSVSDESDHARISGDWVNLAGRQDEEADTDRISPDSSDCNKSPYDETVFLATGKKENCYSAAGGIAYKAILAENDNDSSLCLADNLPKGREAGVLAGIFVAAFPGDSPKSMGWDIGFDADKCRQMAHMDTAAVLPEYRGHQLQYRLMQTAEQELRRIGFRYLAATVHPENHASKNTMLRQGYQVMITKEKYGGHLRDVMLKVLD